MSQGQALIIPMSMPIVHCPSHDVEYFNKELCNIAPFFYLLHITLRKLNYMTIMHVVF